MSRFQMNDNGFGNLMKILQSILWFPIEKKISESWFWFCAPKLSYFGRFIFAPSRRQLLKIYCHLCSSHWGSTKDRERQREREKKRKTVCPTHEPSPSASMYVCAVYYSCTANVWFVLWRRIATPVTPIPNACMCAFMRKCTRCELFA